MAVEQLAGHESIEAMCPTCRVALTCPTDPTHGPHVHLAVTRRAIRALLDRHGIDVPEKALKIRHPLVHGGLGYTFEKRLALNLLVPRLRRAVEQELSQRLAAREGLTLPEDTGRGSMTIEVQYPCEFRTAFPSEPFSPDAPTLEEVTAYLDATRRGVQHSKIITLVEGPPPW